MSRVAVVALAALAALAACATTGEPIAPPPPSFREVRTLVLVRTTDGRAGRPKDPLDGLDESLRARGYTTRVVELGSRPPPDQAALERLFVQLESRAGAPRTDRFGARSYGDAGRAAGETVAALGVDAVASYHRLEGRRPLPHRPPSRRSRAGCSPGRRSSRRGGRWAPSSSWIARGTSPRSPGARRRTSTTRAFR